MRRALRKPAAVSAPTRRTARPAIFPAPVGGWIRNQNLATPGARLPNGAKVNGAFVLENYFPTTTGIRMRRGSETFATIGNGLLDTASLFAYVNGNNVKLFGATTAALYDITAGAHVATPAIAGLNGGDWSSAQFATPGGIFLRAVNGVDTPLVYDGAAFSASPAISGVDANTLSYVWVHQRRLFFVKKNSLSAFYLPADSIGGAAVELPLGGVFTRGGSLLFGSSWSLETGGGGLSEQCVFVTTEGEAAIFQGTDPSVSTSWSKVGVYRIGKPRGAKAHIRAGGDLVIATDIGFVPLSQAIQRDVSALSPTAVSYPIEDAWNEAVALRSAEPWGCEVWPAKQMVLVSLPTIEGSPPQMLVGNARTGAWGVYTGWDGKCLQLFGDRLFFGSTAGRIIEAEVTGSDDGIPYTSICVPLFDALKAPASLKTSLLMRATLKARSEIIPQLSLQADYNVSLPPSPDPSGTIADGGGGVSVIVVNDAWGSGIWGVSFWGVPQRVVGSAPGDQPGGQMRVFQRWQPVGGSGQAIAPGIQITSAGIGPTDVELVQVDITYDMGDIVT